MFRKPAFLLFATTLSITASIFANPEVERPTVTLKYENAESFSDIESHGGNSSKESFHGVVSSELARFIKSSFAGEFFITLTFKDIDLAGRMQKLAGVEVRGLKSVSPAKMQFVYQLRDSDGTVIMTGEERLIDTSFLSLQKQSRGKGAFGPESGMLTEWLNRLDISPTGPGLMTAGPAPVDSKSEV